MNALERFIKYTKIDTQSDDTTGKTPSTEKQKNLSKVLVEDLKALGVKDAYMDEYGIVYGHLDGEGDKIGLNAHIDTALEISGTNANPRIIEKYDGKDIKLNEEYSLTIKQFPSLKNHINHDLVVTDGTTLLGGDDKAGIAIIMGAIEKIMSSNEKHHPVSIAFTVDEEIGEGSDHFDLKKMDADYAFTIDGGDIDCLDYINFNAQQVHIKVIGVAVHPGEGKNALINAHLVMNNIINELPKEQTPYYASYDDGYWHINSINGNSAECDMYMILRDFDKQKLDEKNVMIEKAVKKIQKQYPQATIEMEITWQYENMEPYVLKDSRPLIKAKEALIKNGIKPRSTKIRGGTDGAAFSKMGLVTPNLGTGSYNHHGRYEYLDVQEFYKMIDVVCDIIKG